MCRCPVVPGGLLVAKADISQTFGMGQPQKVGDRDTGYAVQGVDFVELQRINDEVETVG